MDSLPGQSHRTGRDLAVYVLVICLAACQPVEDPAVDAVGAPTGDVPAPEVSVDTGSAAGAAADTASTPLTAAGWGPLRIGMTRAELVAAAGADANPEAVGGPEPEQCEQLRPERAPERMLVMIERDRLTRISLLSGSTIRTGVGIRVGDPAAAVKAAYPDRAVVGAHKYLAAPAEYITVWETDPDAPNARGIVYEVGTDGRVSHIHAGGPSIRYVEGCL